MIPFHLPRSLLFLGTCLVVIVAGVLAFVNGCAIVWLHDRDGGSPVCRVVLQYVRPELQIRIGLADRNPVMARDALGVFVASKRMVPLTFEQELLMVRADVLTGQHERAVVRLDKIGFWPWLAQQEQYDLPFSVSNISKKPYFQSFVPIAALAQARKYLVEDPAIAEDFALRVISYVESTDNQREARMLLGEIAATKGYRLEAIDWIVSTLSLGSVADQADDRFIRLSDLARVEIRERGCVVDPFQVRIALYYFYLEPITEVSLNCRLQLLPGLRREVSPRLLGYAFVHTARLLHMGSSEQRVFWESAALQSGVSPGYLESLMHVVGSHPRPASQVLARLPFLTRLEDSDALFDYDRLALWLGLPVDVVLFQPFIDSFTVSRGTSVFPASAISRCAQLSDSKCIARAFHQEVYSNDFSKVNIELEPNLGSGPGLEFGILKLPAHKANQATRAGLASFKRDCHLGDRWLVAGWYRTALGGRAFVGTRIVELNKTHFYLEAASSSVWEHVSILSRSDPAYVGKSCEDLILSFDSLGDVFFSEWMIVPLMGLEKTQ